MSKKPTAVDAQLILQIFDLRREAEMRKARNWWTVSFWPANADDFIKVGNAFPSQENAWLRQAAGYWEMVASLAVHGTVNQKLFLEPSVSGEMYFIFAKVSPFLKELRQKMQSPTMFQNVEKVINSSKASREFLKIMEGRIAARRKAMAEGKVA